MLRTTNLLRPAFAFCGILASLSCFGQGDLQQEIVRDLERTEAAIGQLSATVEIQHPTMTRTDGRNARSGIFHWESDGPNRFLIEHEWQHDKDGELKLADDIYTFHATEMKAGPSPLFQVAKSRGEISFANPALCFGYGGTSYSQLAREGKVSESNPTTVVIEGSREGKAFRLVVSKVSGRWCMREVTAGFGTAGRYFVTSAGWTSLEDGTFAPTGGTFWAGGESFVSRRSDEVFKVSAIERTAGGLSASRVLKPGTIVTATDGVHVVGPDGRLRLLRPTTAPAKESGARPIRGRELSIVVLGACLLTLLLLTIRRKARKKAIA